MDEKTEKAIKKLLRYYFICAGIMYIMIASIYGTFNIYEFPRETLSPFIFSQKFLFVVNFGNILLIILISKLRNARKK